MPKIVLSDVGLRSLQLPPAGQVDYWDDKFPAFGVRVSQGGAKTFVLNIHNSRRSIGRYPIVSLAEARAEAKRMLAEKTLGKVRPQSITYAQALELFLEEKKKTRRASTHQNHRLRLNQHFGFKGQLADYTHHEFVRKLSRIKNRSEYDHSLSVAKTFFTWAMNRRYITDNPTRGLSPHGSTSRSRVLTDDELRKVWKAAGELGKFGTIVRLLMLTGQRRGEIAALQAPWITDGSITLPATLTKNGREHTFPIASLCHATLTSISTTGIPSLLFPARRSNSSQTPFNGWSKSKAALDKLSGVTGWVLHDFRRSYATNMQRLGVRLEVVERLLNHISGSFGGVVGIYQRHDYMEEMRDAVHKYEAWFCQHVIQSSKV